jgi:hypothetical protein
MLTSLSNSLDPFDPLDLLQITGALQLCPENVHNAIRIEALGHAAACMEWQEGKPQISNHRLNQILNTPPVSQSNLKAYEDPSNNLFTESFSFFGGQYIVFPGTDADTIYTLKNLLSSLFFNKSFDGKAALKNEIYKKARCILLISDYLAKELDFKRNMSITDGDGDVSIPYDLHAKKTMVTLSHAQMAAILEGVPVTTLAPFLTTVGSLTLDQYDIFNSPLLISPIVEHQENYVVVFPWMLLSSLRLHILQTISLAGDLEILASSCLDSLDLTVTESFFTMDWMPHQITLPTPDYGINYRSELWQFDSDKACCVVLYSDNFANINFEMIYDAAEDETINQIIEKYLCELEEFIFLNFSDRFNELFFLIVFETSGRIFSVGLSGNGLDSNPTLLILGGANLERIALCEAGNNLALYNFAQANNKLKEQVFVMPPSIIGEYYLYRQHKNSYYINDEKFPDTLILGTEFGKELREEIAEKFDVHAVLYHDGSSYIDVINVHNSREYPIYTPRRSLIKRDIELFVETDQAFWITADNSIKNDARLSEIHPSPALMIDFLSYWLWAFRSDFSDINSTFSNNRVINIFVTYNFESDWSSPPAAEDPYLSWVTSQENYSIELTIHPGIKSVIDGPSNAGELACMGLVLEAIADLWNQDNKKEAAKSLTERIVSLLEEHQKPLKKKLISIDANRHPQLIPVSGISYPLIQEYEIGLVLDEIGFYCCKELGLPPGGISHNEIVPILNKIVGFLYQKLVSIVSSLSPEFLLEFLILRYEALVSERSNRKLTFPTREACFGETEQLINSFTKEISGLNDAARTLRFIIEYVATCPPSGFRKISLGALYELMAVSSEIIERGFQSDLLKYGLVELDYEILNSGRLGYDHEKLKSAQEQYFHIYSQERLRSSQKAFPKWWRKTTETENPSDYIKNINQVFLSEYGFNLKDLALITGELGNIAADYHRTHYARVNKEELTEGLSNTLGWRKEKTNRILDFLFLLPRDDFLSPPNPFHGTDVYPWRFSRSLSYIRRPLIVSCEGDDQYVYWGLRHLFESSEYILDKTNNGNLKTYYNSPEMRSWIGIQKSNAGKVFVDDIMGSLSAVPDLIADDHVKKINKDRIGHPGDFLGDIDILLINPSKKDVYVIECKDFLVAKTPYEMHREIEELVIGEKSTVRKHSKRSAWVEGHLNSVLQAYGCSPLGIWKAHPLIVVSHELMSPYFKTSSIPIVSQLSLSKMFS